jgi:cell wall-associated NlpC family hydrolase
MKTLVWGLLMASALFAFGCTAAVRYSPADNAFRRNPQLEPVGDTTRMPDYDSRDVRREEPSTRGNEDARHDPTAIGSGAQIDQSIMYRIISRYLDTPYEKGGSGKLGLDCSGLVYVVYRDYDGTRLPLSVQSLYRLDNRVDYDDISFGDLLFFRIDDRRVSHVGIFVGNGRFVHASESRGVVIDDLADEYFATRYAGARRVR